MPVLQFKGKTVVENYHHTLPHHRLEFDRDLSLLAKDKKPSLDGNLIIEGDNLLALKALLPTHAGKVKCIYIDPPYNTGNEGWVYNDNLTQPQFKEWISRTVGKEGEDACRHDKWCCMMYPRLTLLKELLSDEGVIMVSIGDDELASLIHLLDEIFGEQNRAGIFSWKARAKPSNVGKAKYKPQQVVEYICVYAQTLENVRFRKIESGEDRVYPHQRPDGRHYRLQTVLKSNRGESTRETMRFEIAGYMPPEDQRWQGGERFIQDLYDAGSIEFVEGTPFRRYFQDEEPDEHDPLYAFLPPEWTGTAESGKQELNKILGNQHGFDTVKPTQLIQRLIEAVTAEEDLILDSFAGSATTAHAVLLRNHRMGGSRRFILIQMPWETLQQRDEDSNLCRVLTRERVCRVMQGYTVKSTSSRRQVKVPGLGGSFTYARVGEPLFGEYRDFGEKLPAFEEIAKYIFYTETSREFPGTTKKQNPVWDKKAGRIGEHAGRSYYLLYLPNEREDRGLDREFLETIASQDSNCELVVYCERLAVHLDELRKFFREHGKRIRHMLIPFNL